MAVKTTKKAVARKAAPAKPAKTGAKQWVFLFTDEKGITKANIADPSKYLSHWPANAGYGAGGATTARPRSATIVITKNDGGVVGT